MPGKTQGRLACSGEKGPRSSPAWTSGGDLVSTGGLLLSLICDTMNHSALFSKSLILTFWLDQSIR